MHRFFSPNASLHDEIITITEKDEVHHMRHVLRLEQGSPVCVFNGSGEEALGSILKFKDNQAEVKIDSLQKIKQKESIPVILACAIPKKAKFELIIEKCTELGVDEIIPLKTKRTEVLLDHERAQKKAERYQKKAINAAKQSQRTTVPAIHPVIDFAQVVNSLDKHCAAFIPCLTGQRKDFDQAFKIRNEHKKIIFFIGPEGDFTPQEVSLAIDAGCIPVSLGPTVLKVDTAAITVVALANFFARK